MKTSFQSNYHCFIFSLFLCLNVGIAFAQIPAFPGAEGFGSTTIGGRGGQVLKVTNLNESGPGSLREALQNTSGPRIVVFEVGGTIDLLGNNIVIGHPYVTLGGQTAPGDGIALKHGIIDIKTHDIIIRGLRFRGGSYLNTGQHYYIPGYGGINIKTTDAYNIIVDHCSFAWGVSANSGALEGSHDITFSWNIFAEGLHCNTHPENCHSKGLVLHKTGGGNYSAHHNIFSSNDERNPNIKSAHNEVINNYIYNYGSKAMHVWLVEGYSANIMGNYVKPGGDSSNPLVEGIPKGIFVEYAINPLTSQEGTVAESVYVLNNIGPGRATINSNDPNEEWQAVDDMAIVRDGLNPTEQEAQSLTPFSQSGISIHPTESLETILFDPICGAGAIIPYRDPVDVRVLDDIENDNGQIIDCVYPDPIMLEANAQGGSENTIILATQASPIENAYRQRQINIIAGPGAGQSASITQYDGNTLTCTVSPNWTTIPTAASIYQIVIDCSRNAGGRPAMNGGTAPTDTDEDGMPDTWEMNNGTNPNVADAHGDVNDNDYSNIEDYINSFYCSAVALNTEIMDFTAICDKENGTTLVEWSAATHNLAFFELEKSGDGQNWTKMQSFRALTTQPSSFYFEDKSQISTYYRLKIVTTDGSIKYSKVIKSSCERQDLFNIYPNPASTAIWLEMGLKEEQALTLQLFHANGQRIKTMEVLPQKRMVLEREGLADGVYFLKVYGDGSLLGVEKVVWR